MKTTNNIAKLYYVEIWQDNDNVSPYVLQSCYFMSPAEAEAKFIDKVDFLREDYHMAIMSVEYGQNENGDFEFGDITTCKTLK